MRVVVDILARAVDLRGAVAAQKADVVHHRILARHPLQRDRSCVDAVGVDTDSREDVGAALRRLDDGLRRPDALEGSSPVRQYERGGAGVQAHQHAVRLQNDRIGDAIFPSRKVQTAMTRHRAADRLRVVRLAVALHSQPPYVDPGLTRWQGRQVRSVRGQRLQRYRLKDGPDRPGRAEIGEVQPVRKDLHFVSLAPARRPSSRSRESGRIRHALADHVLHIEFGPLALLAADDQGRSADVLHPPVFHPEFFGVPRIDRDRRRNVPEHRVNQRQSGLMFFDRGHRLAFKRGVH